MTKYIILVSCVDEYGEVGSYILETTDDEAEAAKSLLKALQDCIDDLAGREFSVDCYGLSFYIKCKETRERAEGHVVEIEV